MWDFRMGVRVKPSVLLETFWNKQNRRDAELKLQAQGAAPSPRSAAQAKRHQRDFLNEQPRTLEKEKKGKGPAPRPAGSGATKSEPKEKRKPAAPGASSKSKQKMQSVAENDIWEDDTWGGPVDEDMLRSWDILPGSSLSQTRGGAAPR